MKNSFTLYKGLKIIGISILICLTVYVVFIFINNGQLTSSQVYPEHKVEEEIIPPPPKIDYDISQHEKKFFHELFKDCNLSGDKKQLAEACDYSNSIVRNKAVQIAGQNEGTYNLGQVCNIFDFCYNNWKYVNDPRSSEIIEYASNTDSNCLNEFHI